MGDEDWLERFATVECTAYLRIILKPVDEARMKIAVICVGYSGNTLGIALLAEYFGRIGGDLYIHVDKKVDISPYEPLANRYRNVQLLVDRYEYFWGGFSGCLAITSALEFAAKHDDYDRFVYLTEDSAPLISGQVLVRKFLRNVEYFSVAKASEDWLRRRYEGFFYYDAPQMNPRLMDQIHKEVTDNFLEGLGRLVSLRKRGKVPLNEIYHGPAYFALSRPAILELLDTVRGNEHLRTSFEFSAIPEEQYFHTVLGNSSAGYVFRPFILMEMSGNPAPMVYRTTAELEERSSWGPLFIRKVASSIPQIESFVRRLID